MSEDSSAPCWWVVSLAPGIARLSPCRSLEGAETMSAMLRMCGCVGAHILSLEPLSEAQVEQWCRANRLRARRPGPDV